MEKLFKNKELLIFDCDGVIFDSYNANILYFNHCLELAGYLPLTEDGINKVVYMSTNQLVQELIHDPEEVRRVMLLTQNTDYTPFIRYMEPLFNLEQTFDQLKKKYHLALASNRGASLIKLMEHFSLMNFFEHAISTLGARPKPDPDMLNQCLSHFGISSEKAVYLGDSRTDYEAAQSAKIDFVWVGHDKGSPNIAAVDELLDHLH